MVICGARAWAGVSSTSEMILAFRVCDVNRTKAVFGAVSIGSAVAIVHYSMTIGLIKEEGLTKC